MPTQEICSACLEFFDVLGSAFQLKYVVPCPGAALYAGLPVNRYIAVESRLPRGRFPDIAAESM